MKVITLITHPTMGLHINNFSICWLKLGETDVVLVEQCGEKIQDERKGTRGSLRATWQNGPVEGLYASGKEEKREMAPSLLFANCCTKTRLFHTNLEKEK
jgi:hypothetical protein